VARGTAAVALLPSKETLSGAYFDLRNRLIRSWRRRKPKARSRLRFPASTACGRGSRLGGHVGSGGAHLNLAIQNNVNVSVARIGERLSRKFDRQPEIKAQIAQAFLEMDDEDNQPPA
jgi:hypothetical protein